MNMWRAKNIKGFTFIELLVVIGLITTLSAIVIASFDPLSQLQKGEDARRKSDIAQVRTALESYYQDFGRYPQSSSEYQIMAPVAIEWGSSWTPYIEVLPKDKLTKKYAYYVPDATGQTYYLYASLDRGGKDPEACNNGAQCSSVPSESACRTNADTTILCNYGISSPNVSP